MEEQNKLARRAKRGDVEAFGLLYRDIYQDLYRFALYTLGNPTDAQDVVSDTVVDAFASIRKLRSEEAFRGWIFRILSNKCKRRFGSISGHTAELTEEVLLHAAVDHSMDEKAEHLLVRELFWKLEEEERLILAMHLFAGYTSREIAKHLQMNENTVRSRESRALKRMRKQLEGT